jgi:hypothetical protein
MTLGILWSALMKPAKQLVSETRVPLPSRPGQVARYDYEYRRNGVRNLFIFFEPLRGWRHVKVISMAHQGGLGIVHETAGG